MNMKRVNLILSILSVCLPLPNAESAAQDFLEPETGVLSDFASIVDDYAKIKRYLLRGGDDGHEGRMICLPSFEPEWAVTLRQTGPEQWVVDLDEAREELCSAADPSAVKIVRSKSDVDAATAHSVFAVWVRMLKRVHYAEGFLGGHDGVSYHFSSGPIGDKIRCGQCWAPEQRSGGDEPVELLVTAGENLKDYVRSSKDGRAERLKKLKSTIERLDKLLDSRQAKGGPKAGTESQRGEDKGDTGRLVGRLVKMGILLPAPGSGGFWEEFQRRYRLFAVHTVGDLGGRPGGRRLYSRPSALAVASVQVGSPSGRSRRIETRTRATSSSSIRALTSSTQPAPRGAGPGSRGIGPGEPAARPWRLDQRHSSARSTSLARKGLRSTYRGTTRRWSSSWIGKDLNRPCQMCPLEW